MRRTVTEPPAAGPPWDLPLEEAPLAFVDLEMTGLEPATDRVIEICIERVRGSGMEDRIHTLVRPEMVGAEVGNQKIHGIDAAALASAPSFVDIADHVERLLDGAVFVAHGAQWDVAFLEGELARAGRPRKIGHWLDTLNLSRRTFALPRHSLEALRVHFGIDNARAHRADADVAALREVFARCVAALDPKSPRDIWEVRIAERKARAEIVAECTEIASVKGEVTVFYRPRAKPPEELRMVFTEVVLGLDPPRVIGYQLPGRGRRELRADRILRLER